MRFVIFGLGAIGTYIGVSLIKAGHRVVFIERPEVAANSLNLRLRLAVAGNELIVKQPSVVTSLAQAMADGPADVAIVAVKSFDTVSLAAQLAEQRAAFQAVMTLQNGVENEDVLAKVLGAGSVISATLTSAVGRRGLGDVVLERKRGLGLVNTHPLSQALFQALDAAQLNPRLYDSAGAMKWSKLLTNLLVNASSAILDMTPAEILTHPGLYAIEVGQIRETLAVMAALGYPVVDLPGTPVRAEAFIFKHLPTAISRPIVSRAIVGGRGAKMPSFHIDLKAGRPVLEVDYLNGAVVRAGQRVAVPTPVNAGLNRILMEIAAGQRPWQAYAQNPERLIAEMMT